MSNRKLNSEAREYIIKRLADGERYCDIAYEVRKVFAIEISSSLICQIARASGQSRYKNETRREK